EDALPHGRVSRHGDHCAAVGHARQRLAHVARFAEQLRVTGGEPKEAEQHQARPGHDYGAPMTANAGQAEEGSCDAHCVPAGRTGAWLTTELLIGLRNAASGSLTGEWVKWNKSDNVPD